MPNVRRRSRRKEAVLFLRTSATFLGIVWGGGGGVLGVAHGSAFFQVGARAEDIIQRTSNHKRAHAAAGPIAAAGEGCDLVAESGEKGEGEGV